MLCHHDIWTRKAGKPFASTRKAGKPFASSWNPSRRIPYGWGVYCCNLGSPRSGSHRCILIVTWNGAKMKNITKSVFLQRRTFGFHFSADFKTLHEHLEGGKTLRKHSEGGKTLRKLLEPLSQDPVRLGGLLLQSRIPAVRISSLHSLKIRGIHYILFRFYLFFHLNNLGPPHVSHLICSFSCFSF